MALNIRFDDGVEQELSELSDVYSMSKNALVNSLIRQEYNKIKSDPEITRMLNQLKELQAVLNKFNA